MLPYVYLLPAFLVMSVITFYPLIYQVIISFTDFQTKDLLLQLASPKLQNVGLQNYIDIITGGLPVQNFEFFRVLTYNIWWALTNVLVHVPAGVVIAVLLNTPGLWGKRLYRAVYVLPVVVPPIVVAVVWQSIFHEQYGARPVPDVGCPVLWFTGCRSHSVAAEFLPPFAAPARARRWLVPMMIANFWLVGLHDLVATGAPQSIPKDLYGCTD
jgi:arabinogalactan oligomer/maltooligosaccharide transport system permease protein